MTGKSILIFYKIYDNWTDICFWSIMKQHRIWRKKNGIELRKTNGFGDHACL